MYNFPIIKMKIMNKIIRKLLVIAKAPSVFLRAIVDNFPSEVFGNRLRYLYYRKRFYSFGQNTQILQGCLIYYPELIQIGSNSSIGRFTDLNPGPGAGDAPYIIIGDYAFIGPYTYFRSANHLFGDPDKLFIEQGHEEKKIIIGNDVYCGAHCIFLGGTKIGDHCVIAAGSVVSGEIPPYSVVGGNPARVIRKRK